MILPQTAEYALRAMAHLALMEPNAVAPAGVLSEQTGIPVPYLSKILRKLVTARLLVARRGPGGGFALALLPKEVTFGMILEAVDYQLNPGHCAFGWGACNKEQACPLHQCWSSLKHDFYEWAEHTSLADIEKLRATVVT